MFCPTCSFRSVFFIAVEFIVFFRINYFENIFTADYDTYYLIGRNLDNSILKISCAIAAGKVCVLSH